MKKVIFLFLLMVVGSVGLHAQDAVWKLNLIESVAKKFTTSKEVAKKVVDVKESFFRQMQWYKMPHIETKMSREEITKAVEDLRKKEIMNIGLLLSDEAKATEVSAFLEGKIPVQSSQPRRR